MSSRAIIQAKIDNNIRNKTPKVAKVEHADVEDLLLDEMYKVSVDDSSLSEIYTLATSNSSFPYFIKITKIGRRIFIEGWVINLTNSFMSNTTILTFRDIVATLPNEFLPDSTIDPNTSASYVYRGEGVRSQDESRIRLLVLYESGVPKLRISGNFTSLGTTNAPNYRFHFNFSYNSKI